MTVSHEKAIIAYYCLTACSRSAIHCNAFTYCSVISDYGKCILAAELKILRYCRNNGTGKYRAIFADTCTFHYGHVASNACTLADFNILVDGYKRVYDYARSNLGRRMYVS